jgi:lysophospholipase L1-like esterase/predicted GH43/DUF377 family glycosyl hydrolase
MRHGGGPQECDKYGARDVWVFEHGGTYYMHYDAAGPTGWLCALATSTDLTRWTKHGNVLELGSTGEGDSASASYGTTYLADDGTWHMFYLGTPHVSPAPDRIPSFPYLTMKARATAPAGPWQKQKEIVPFRPKPGTYYSDTASPGQIIRKPDGEYLQFFSASTRERRHVRRTIGIARTRDLNSTWSVDEKPIVPLEEQIENSSLYFEPLNQTWFLFTNHIGLDGPGTPEYTDSVWVYWTKDLEHWDAANKAVVLDGTNCVWSRKCIGLPSVVKVGNRLAIFYDAPGGDSTSHMARDVGLAWLELPLKVPTSEPKIVASGMTVHVPAGDYIASGKPVKVSTAADLQVAPADFIEVRDEKWKLPEQLPSRWGPGVHLRKCVAANALPDCVDAESIVVRLPDGTRCERDKDYSIEPRWAGVARLPGGRITTDTEVSIDYRASMMRIDSIAVDPQGQLTLVTGEPACNTPQQPQLTTGSVRLANVFMWFRTKALADWQIMSIGEPFPEPNPEELKQRAATIPKTLQKLREHKPVLVATWGDSVTAGGDSSRASLAYANLFLSQLRDRFPASVISHINAGIGGTNTDHRLPGLQQEVLSHHPDLVTIEFVNDMDFPAEKLRKNYAQAIEQIRAAGAEIILLTPHFTMMDFMHKQQPRGPETRPAVETLRQIAAEHHIGLADAARRWEHLDVEGIPYVTLLANGINHPEDRGHQFFVDELMTFFAEVER